MTGNITILNPDSFIKGFEDFQCGKIHAIQISSKDFLIAQWPVKPLKGYKSPKGYPECCPSHKSIYKFSLNKYNSFPDCCEQHRQLNSAPWFKKENFSYLPMKITDSLSYTKHCIEISIEKSNWYKLITDYIDLTARSFGQLPEGYGPPLGLENYLLNIESNINSIKGIDSEKKNKIIGFVQNWGKGEASAEPIDLNLLITTYKTWVKDFPFDIPFFSHLKDHFEKQLPLVEKKNETNLYSGWTSVKLKSYPALIQFLVETTEKILTEINTLVLYEKGVITDFQKSKIDIINASHRFNLKHLTNNHIHGRSEYTRIIKDWFKYEKQYITELSEALSSEKIKPASSSKINSPIIALFCYLLNDSGIAPRQNSESVTIYCKRLCKQFKFTYSDKVRQAFSNSSSNKNLHKVKSLILPALEPEIAKKLSEHIDNKIAGKTNLYA